MLWLALVAYCLIAWLLGFFIAPLAHPQPKAGYRTGDLVSAGLFCLVAPLFLPVLGSVFLLSLLGHAALRRGLKS